MATELPRKFAVGQVVRLIPVLRRVARTDAARQDLVVIALVAQLGDDGFMPSVLLRPVGAAEDAATWCGPETWFEDAQAPLPPAVPEGTHE